MPPVLPPSQKPSFLRGNLNVHMETDGGQPFRRQHLSPELHVMVMVMVMVVVVVVVGPCSGRGKGDNRCQKHRRENFLHHFFLLRASSGPQWGRETQDTFCEPL
ncbi:MAG: hypothetical protein WBE80_08825 [Methylocella sp.]